MYIYIYTHTYVRIYTYIHTYTFCKSRKRILVTYLVTDDQTGSATQFLGRYQGAPSTGRAATRNQRTLSASSRRYVFDHFDLRCLGRFDFWHFRLNIHAIREIGRSVFRFFFFLFFLDAMRTQAKRFTLDSNRSNLPVVNRDWSNSRGWS